jgi:hypothetical protein
METSVTAGRLPYQIKLAIQSVVKARVFGEGCNPVPASRDLFFGMDIVNVLRFFDGADDSLATTPMDPTCDTKFAFNWKKLRDGFRGINLPNTCNTATYLATKKCQAKFKIVENLFLEIIIEEKCNTESQTGYGLPSLNAFCSGSLCDVFAKPCTTNSDCGTGVTCGTLKDVNLIDALKPLMEFGLYNNLTDPAQCDQAGQPKFQQKFWSEMINSGAYLFGLTNTVGTAVYSDVRLCGIDTLQDRYISTAAPTPADSYSCYDGISRVAVNKVCNGVNDCSNGQDEMHCNHTCGVGFWDASWSDDNPDMCCPPCVHGNEYPGCWNSYCGTYGHYDGGGDITFEVVCPPTGDATGPIDCPNFLYASTTALPGTTVARQGFTTTSPTASSSHVLGWSDCNGNVQIGSSSEIGSLNARIPIHAVMHQIERVISSVEGCRLGSDATGSQWAKHFYPWSVNFWGGLFYSNLAAQNVYNEVNPGAKLDSDLRYYASSRSQTYDQNTWRWVYVNAPPFADVKRAPSSCDLTSTGTGVCELAADVDSWFSGSFPINWNSPTAIKAKVSSSCSTGATSSSVPTAFVTCEGGCNETVKSGCCILRNLLAPKTNGVCPAGYKLTLLESELTDFILNSHSWVTRDTTLENLLSLVLGQHYKFGVGGATFIEVTGAQASVCLVDGTSFKTNLEAWGKAAFTEDCPVGAPVANGAQGCPQFRDVALKGCSGAACLGTPVTADTPTIAPTQTPTPSDPNTDVGPAPILAPVFGIFVALGLL